MTKRHKPSSPEEARRKLAEKADREAEIARLERQGVHVTAAPNKQIIRAVRLDCFDLLLSRSALSQTAHDAVRWLEEQIAIASGSIRSEQTLDRVDTTTLGQNVSQSMIIASENVRCVLKNCGPRNARLLRALLEPSPTKEGSEALLSRWRETVKQVTGETLDKGQVAAIRQACENLSEARRKMGYGKAA